jgi:hypothetical protein
MILKPYYGQDITMMPPLPLQPHKLPQKSFRITEDGAVRPTREHTTPTQKSINQQPMPIDTVFPSNIHSIKQFPQPPKQPATNNQNPFITFTNTNPSLLTCPVQIGCLLWLF